MLLRKIETEGNFRCKVLQKIMFSTNKAKSANNAEFTKKNELMLNVVFYELG